MVSSEGLAQWHQLRNIVESIIINDDDCDAVIWSFNPLKFTLCILYGCDWLVALVPIQASSSLGQS